MAQKKQPRGWRHMAAGSAAGGAAVLALHPFDVIKTRLQVQDGAAAVPQYRGTLHAIRCIFQQEGWRGFYAGLTPAIVGSAVAWGTYFYLYEAAKEAHQKWLGVERLGPGWNYLSAAEAGGAVCLMTNPIWLIKTRLQLQRRSVAVPASLNPAPPYDGMLHAFVTIAKTEGLAGLYKGLVPSFILQTTHGAVQFAVYEELKHLASALSTPGWPFNAHHSNGAPRAPKRSTQELNPAETLVCGALSKLVAAVTTYPVQTVRSRLQQRFEGRQLVYRSGLDAVRLTFQREGLRGFYKGLLPSLLRVMPQSAVTITIYERLVQLLRAQQDAAF